MVLFRYLPMLHIPYSPCLSACWPFLTYLIHLLEHVHLHLIIHSRPKMRRSVSFFSLDPPIYSSWESVKNSNSQLFPQVYSARNSEHSNLCFLLLVCCLVWGYTWLCPTITHGYALRNHSLWTWGVIWDAGDQIWVSCMQGKHHIHCTTSLLYHLCFNLLFRWI